MPDPFWTASATGRVKLHLLNANQTMTEARLAAARHGLNPQARLDLASIIEWCRQTEADAKALLDADKSNEQRAA